MATTLKLKTIRSGTYLSDIQGYNGEMGILDRKGRLAFELVGCKEEFYWAVAKWIGFHKSKYAQYAYDYLDGPHVETNIDTRKMRVVFVYRDEDRKNAAMRVLRVLEAVRNRLHLRTRTAVSCSTKMGVSVILVELDRWFLRSPVSISAALTFIRAALFSKFEFNNLDDFLNKMIELDDEYESENDYEDISLVFDDAAHLNKAKKNGNLDGFFLKNLPCLRRRDLADCQYFTYNDYDEPFQAGIVGYDRRDGYSRLTDECVKRLAHIQDDDEEDDCSPVYGSLANSSTWWSL